MFRGGLLLGCAAGLLASGAAHAHHSRAFYDMTAEVVIEGTVATLDWKNPHISMTVETAGPDGASVLQEVEVLSVSEAAALGLRREAIVPGSHVVVRARPGRRGPGSRAFGLDVRTSDGVVFPLNTDAGFAIPAAAVEAEGIAGRWAPSVAEFNAVFPTLLAWPLIDRAPMMAAVSQPGALLGVCADYPPPLLVFFPDLREIEVGDASVVMRFEAQGQDLERVVWLDRTEHPADVEPTLMGHSIGRWEGETLVIDTAAFAPHPRGVIIGVPSGSAKRMVERLTLAEDRLHLVYEMTLEDPEHLTGPASLSMEWEHRPDLEPSGQACDLEVAQRLLEEEAP